ncbi:hypothetical protein Clacol_001061 [Clathrus columnatus]|uniref:C2H2-type domain-containing protein n=1 Tax=Clathrus columnatus TaxID=1419009 RepID=A0AAV5A4P4_9AGAM|nr:hypothetical protein Clacol_001061 [Clathrus columnatus]
MSSVFANFPAPMLPQHNVHAVPRSLSMPSAPQAPNFPVQPPSSQSQSQQSAPIASGFQDPKKRHACPTCGRAFTTSGHLARHIRVHTGERNHKCPFPGCETRCSRQDNLQQHYRIHLSPGSRRSSSTRARAEAKKKSSLSSANLSSLSPNTTRSTLNDEPPDSPPPLARATVLPPSRTTYPVMNHERSDQSQQGRSHSSASASGSGSSAGSPHSYTSATASPDITPSVPPSTGVGTNGGYGNILGLSHERQHSPGGEYSYSSSYPQTSSNGHVYHHPHHPQRPMNADNYGLPSGAPPQYSTGVPPSTASSYAHSLPPIQSLDGTNGSGSFGLARVSQHPGPYPSYESTPNYPNHGHSASNWPTPETSYSHPPHPHHNTWWSQNGVSVGVSVGAGSQRGYQSYGSS